MVFFTCDSCGESLKKNQVEKHYKFKCRSCSVLTCVDCQKEFPGDSYIEHTKCITEDEKYGGKNYQAKSNANKGLKKQNAWIENLQDVVASKSQELDPDVKSVVDTIITFENIPRKKPKFINFAKNVLGGGRRSSPQTLEKTWELLQLALKKPEEKTEEGTEKNVDSPKKRKNEGDSDATETPAKKGKVDESSGDADEASKKESKRDKKEKKKGKKKSDSSDEANTTKSTSVDEVHQNGESKAESNGVAEEGTKKKKDKKKDKRKSESVEEVQPNGESKSDKEELNGTEEHATNWGVKRFKGTGKKGVADTTCSETKSEEHTETPAKKSKVPDSNGDADEPSKKDSKREKKEKKKDKKKSDSVDEANTTVDTITTMEVGKIKFDWEGAAVKVLENKGSSMKVARLKKKVMKAYWDGAGKGQQLGAEDKQKLEAKMDKKLRKSEKVEFSADSVCLKGQAGQDSSSENESKQSKSGDKTTLVTEDNGVEEDKGLKAEVAQMLSELKSQPGGEVGRGGLVGSFNQWEKANLGDDGSNEKFRRLMGLGKKGGTPSKSNLGARHGSSVADQDQVSRMFSQQEDQFKRALGTKRGMGLGFGAKEEVKPQNKKITFD